MSATWCCSAGGGHDLDSANAEFWSFIDRKGCYSFITWLLSESETSSEEISITRQIDFGSSQPDTETIACIKEALREHSRSFIFNLEHYKRSQLTLIDSDGKEI